MPELLPTMNDTKWRRLLNAIASIPLPKSYWKFLNDHSEYERPTPQPKEILNDAAIGDTSVIGPFYFRDVQSVRWPEYYESTYGPHEPPRISVQPINELATAIAAAGQFDTHIIDGDLVLYAYREIG